MPTLQSFTTVHCKNRRGWGVMCTKQGYRCYLYIHKTNKNKMIILHQVARRVGRHSSRWPVYCNARDRFVFSQSRWAASRSRFSGAFTLRQSMLISLKINLERLREFDRNRQSNDKKADRCQRTAIRESISSNRVSAVLIPEEGGGGSVCEPGIPVGLNKNYKCCSVRRCRCSSHSPTYTF